MRTLLICHDDAPLDREGLARWLASFSDVAGSVVIQEPARRRRRRILREIRRVGPVRFLDVAAFRAYHALVHGRATRTWEARALDRLRARFPAPASTPELVVASPNTPDAARFIAQQAPDLVLARCKTLIHERVFTIPRLGTFVMHPGICPEYRNAHGCFWALAAGDLEKIGMTLLKIDRGIDTGPVFAHFHVDPAPHESHVITQHRSVLDHLDGIRETLEHIASGTAVPIDTTGRRTATWGQPWLSAYLRNRRAIARSDASARASCHPTKEPAR